jgi:hypothetical protein
MHPIGSITRCDEGGECVKTDLSAEEFCPDGQCTLTATGGQSIQQSITQQCVNGECSCSKTTCVDGNCMEESCQCLRPCHLSRWFAFAPAKRVVLPYPPPWYLVGLEEQGGGDCEAERVGSAEADHGLKGHRLFHRQVGGRDPLESLIEVCRSAPLMSGKLDAWDMSLHRVRGPCT